MNTNWAQADSWYRRDTGDGGYLTVSRARNGTWSWLWRISRTGAVFGAGAGHASHRDAMRAADRASSELYEAVS